MAMIPAWIAFGPGERHTGADVTGLPFLLPAVVRLNAVRWGFGAGALLMLVFATAIWGQVLQGLMRRLTWKPARIGVHLIVFLLLFSVIGAPVLKRDTSGLGRTGDDPVIHLGFDDDVDDEGPFRLAAVQNGDELTLVPGVRGQALFVGGTNDWVDYPVPPDIDLSKSVTLTCWLKRDDWSNPYKNGSSSQILATIGPFILEITLLQRAADSSPWWLEFFSTGHREYRTVHLPKGIVGGFGVTASEDPVPPGEWTHLALVYERGSDLIRLHLNGQRVADRNMFEAPELVRMDTLRIGTWHESNLAFRGSIDEVKVFDYALTDGQIRADAEDRSSRASRSTER